MMSKQSADVSVVVPAYNAEHYIAETLESVLAQTLLPLEILVVDDGSSDETSQIVESISQHHHLVRLINQSNQGGARARLRGLDEAKGRYIYFLDSDDIALPDALQMLREGFDKQPDACAIYGGADIIDEAGNDLLSFKLGRSFSGDVLADLLQFNFMKSMGCGLIAKDKLLREAFDHGLKIGQDLVVWAQLAAAGGFYSILPMKAVFCYRLHDANVSHKNLTDPERYTACLEWIFSHPPVVEKLTEEQLKALKRRRLAGSYSHVSKQSILQKQWSLSATYAAKALELEPCNMKIRLLWCCAKLRFLPEAFKRRLY